MNAKPFFDWPNQGPATPAIILVETPFAIEGIKKALATSGWPGRDQGLPLPRCVGLDQALSEIVDQALALGLARVSPRPLALRRVQLAQGLLDHPGLSATLGGSAKAALDLAAQWVDIFQGWEWLAHGGAGFKAQAADSGFAADVATLAALQDQNRQTNDSADWAASHAPLLPGFGQTEVIFCLGRTPTPLELAMAKTLWGASDDQLHVVDDSMFSLLSHAVQADTSIPTAITAITPAAPRHCISAHSVEEVAWSAAQIIMDWRAQGLNDIGVVPLDRKAVRRLRALLDRAGEPFTDRTGWSLDTSVAAGAVIGLSELLTHRANTQSLLEWIHSPFVAKAFRQQFGFDAQERQALDAALRGFGRVAPVQLTMLFEQNLLPSGLSALVQLASDQRRSIHAWATCLEQALEQCGLAALLAEDIAGQAIIAALQILRAQSSADSSQVSVLLWQAVLTELFNQSRFSEPPGNSAVRVCSLNSLAWRPPQAVVMVGADAGRLPARPTPRFFEPHRLAEMGLQLSPEITEAEALAQFASVWAAPFPMALIAASDKPDGEVEFSGWIELLSLKPHHFIQTQSATTFLKKRAINISSYSAAPSLEAIWSEPLPGSLSVSALQSLANCSFQFYLQTLCGYAPMTLLEEEAAPSDLGSLLHLVLKKATQPQTSVEEWQQWLSLEIDRVLRTAFFQKRRDQIMPLPIPVALAVSLRTQAQAVVPELAQWLFNRHRSDAQPKLQLVMTEQPVSRPIEPLGITIKGRIDRIELTKNGVRLIDFKTTEAGELKRRVKTVGDDIQLSVYAWLMEKEESLLQGQMLTSAAYVSVRREAIHEITVAAETVESLRAHTQATLELLIQKLRSIEQGEPIRAEGIEKDKKICERCRVRGICRRDDIVIDTEESEAQSE